MEVLFITYKYPPAFGGMQKQSFELINRFKEKAQVHSLIYDQTSSLALFFISLFWRVPRLIRAHKGISVIHCNDGVCGMICSWLRFYKKIKLTVTYHGLDLVFPNWIYQKILLKWMHGFDQVYAVSESTKQACVERGFDPVKVIAIPNGVSVEEPVEFSAENESIENKIKELQDQGTQILVSIGRPVARKGFRWFVENVINGLDKVHYVLIGPYPEYSFVLRSVLNIIPTVWRHQVELFLGLSTEHRFLVKASEDKDIKFTWLTQVNHNDKQFIISQSDLFIMPNIKVHGDMEGFGLVALEANVLEKYVLASNIEGITSAVIQGKNGRLVESQSIEDWQTAIESLLEDTDLDSYGQQAREYVTVHFTWDKMVDGYYNHMEALVKNETRSEDLNYSTSNL